MDSELVFDAGTGETATTAEAAVQQHVSAADAGGLRAALVTAVPALASDLSVDASSATAVSTVRASAVTETQALVPPEDDDDNGGDDDGDGDSGGFPGGAIAGIVVGVAVIAAVGFGAWWLCSGSSRDKKRVRNGADQSGGSQYANGKPQAGATAV